MISVCEMTYTRTAIVAMQQTESDKIVGRSQMNMLHDMLRACAARSRYQNSYAALQVNVIMMYTRCHGDGEGCYAANEKRQAYWRI